jgi:hypothetical protein
MGILLSVRRPSGTSDTLFFERKFRVLLRAPILSVRFILIFLLNKFFICDIQTKYFFRVF